MGEEEEGRELMEDRYKELTVNLASSSLVL
jgi:hypothetical protein